MQSTMIPLNSPLNDGREPGVVVVEMPEHPRDYIVWSVATIFYGNPFCLGLLAFYFSIRARDRKMLGDMNGARSYGTSACWANGCAVALIIIPCIILTVVIYNLFSNLSYGRKFHWN